MPDNAVTVRELIERLSSMPEHWKDLQVYFRCKECDYLGRRVKPVQQGRREEGRFLLL